MYLNIGTEQGYHYPLDAACFGMFKYAEIDENTLYDCFRGDEEDLDDQAFYDIALNEITYIDYVPNESDLLSSAAMGVTNLYAYVSKCLDDIPMLKGMYEVKPRAKAIRFYLKDYPADQIILGLMIARTFCTYFYEYSTHEGYREAFRNGYSPRVCLLGTMIGKSVGLVASEDYTLNGMYENTIFNPHTFGIEAAIAFMRQDETYAPWVQGPLCEDGYTRESGFQGSRRFNLLVPVDRSSPDYDDYVRNGLSTGYRSLTDAFSKEFDSTHFIEEIESNKWGEFKISKIDKSSLTGIFDFLERLRRGK